LLCSFEGQGTEPYGIGELTCVAGSHGLIEENPGSQGRVATGLRERLSQYGSPSCKRFTSKEAIPAEASQQPGPHGSWARGIDDALKQRAGMRWIRCLEPLLSGQGSSLAPFLGLS
jgi:hypothetical protein